MYGKLVAIYLILIILIYFFGLVGGKTLFGKMYKKKFFADKKKAEY